METRMVAMVVIVVILGLMFLIDHNRVYDRRIAEEETEAKIEHLHQRVCYLEKMSCPPLKEAR